MAANREMNDLDELIPFFHRKRHCAQPSDEQHHCHSECKQTAYALGGLGGFNNYLGGFLAALTQHDAPEPGLMSCTTGAIFWTYVYLKSGNPKTNRAKTIQELQKVAKEAASRRRVFGRDTQHFDSFW